MTVFVAYAPADHQAAEGLEKFLERRGLFVELDDGQTALRPVQPSDVVVLLLTGAFQSAHERLRLEQRALDAWSEGRLVVVRVDDSVAPVGLRDIASIEVQAAEETDWQPVAEAVRMKVAGRNRGPEDTRAKDPGPRRRLLGVLGLVAAMAPGVFALWATGAIWLANRIGPVPGGWGELRAGVDQLGMRYGLPAGVTEWVFAAAVLMLLCALAVLVLGLVRRGPAPEGRAGDRNGAVFVAYAQANRAAVLPVIEAAQRAGREVQLDYAANSRGAAATAKAISAATDVVVMCSKAAFDSDEVKREIYLADRFGKKLAPVFIEPADPPVDFEYFFAGAQGLKLYETPEAERPQAFLRALGAPA